MRRSDFDKGGAMPHRFPAMLAAPTPGASRLWLTGARVLDGTGAPVRDGAAVLVEDGSISRISAASEPVPEAALVIECGQRVLMPGLIDIHLHAAGETPATLKGAEAMLPGTAAHFLQAELREYLRCGVTTVRVTG